MSIDTPQIRRNADLIGAFSACPFGNPVPECPFIPYYKLNNERKQIMQIDVIPQEELDELRRFHRACVQRYCRGEWK
ncbi:MAG: hypothetical protein RBS55_09140 [Bacteroidales bacterium]|jgi:hypothetical protein|nr:hypothetical protein [Bacteroidales bacterium]